MFEVGKISILSGLMGRRQEREGGGQFPQGEGREGWDSEPWVWREGGTSHTLTAGGDLERPVGSDFVCTTPVRGEQRLGMGWGECASGTGDSALGISGAGNSSVS